MNCTISYINYFPVKSLSFGYLKSCSIKKNLGIINDRIFAFSRVIDFEKAKFIEKFPLKRKLNFFLTLKNTPVLNKYNFMYDGINLILNRLNKEIISIFIKEKDKFFLIFQELLKLEDVIKSSIFLLYNKNFPFFDTTHSNNVNNSISLINLSSIKDFEIKQKIQIEHDRFRGNFYIKGIKPWEERNWINMIIRINNILFKVEKNIGRCSVTNLQPNTNKITMNLPMSLKKHYNHIDLGVYLTPLSDGKVDVGDEVIINE